MALDTRRHDHAHIREPVRGWTGESVPVGKSLVPVAPDTPLADRRNMVYAGTHVTAGRARVVFVSTGLATGNWVAQRGV